MRRMRQLRQMRFTNSRDVCERGDMIINTQSIGCRPGDGPGEIRMTNDEWRMMKSEATRASSVEDQRPLWSAAAFWLRRDDAAPDGAPWLFERCCHNYCAPDGAGGTGKSDQMGANGSKSDQNFFYESQKRPRIHAGDRL